MSGNLASKTCISPQRWWNHRRAEELTFEPSIFYADLNSFKNCEPPFEGEEIKMEQKNEIVNYISNSDSSTKIIFG